MKRPLIVCAFLCAGLSGCVPDSDPFDRGGEYGPDTVFLYFVNGIPGTDSMTIRAPSGVVARDVQFAERVAVDGSCPQGEVCVPVDIDRSAGGRFTVKSGGQRVVLDLTDELAAFYPQETGTVIIRGAPSAPQATVVRHVQTISTGCAMTVVNGLSVGPLDTQRSGFEVATESRMRPERAGYVDEAATPLVTRCGELPVDHDTHRALARTDLWSADESWFFRTSCSEPGDCFRAGAAVEDDRAVLAEDGAFAAVPTSAEYFDCVADAVTTPSTCPSGGLTWADVEVDWRAVQTCARPATRSAVLTPAGHTDTLFGEEACSVDMRVRTPGQDLVFAPGEGDDHAVHQDGALVQGDGDIPQGSERFWVLLGRPVEPVWVQWDSSDTFVDLRSL